MEEPQNTISHNTSGILLLRYSNRLSLLHQDDCKSRKDTKYCKTNQCLNTEPPQTMRATTSNDSTTVEPTTDISLSNCGWHTLCTRTKKVDFSIKRTKTQSISHKNKTKSATIQVQLVPIGISIVNYTSICHLF